MARKKDHDAAPRPELPRRRATAAGKGRRTARVLAKSTLLAASLAFSQFGRPDLDARFRVFDRTLVDRLQAPITRYHE